MYSSTSCGALELALMLYVECKANGCRFVPVAMSKKVIVTFAYLMYVISGSKNQFVSSFGEDRVSRN